MSKDPSNPFIGRELYIQNTLLDEKKFVQFCKKLGLSEDKSVLPLLVFQTESQVSDFLSRTIEEVLSAEPPIEDASLLEGITAPLFSNMLVDQDDGYRYYSTFQFILIDSSQNSLKYLPNVDKLLRLTMLIQNVYMPFFRSGGKQIRFEGIDERWSERYKNFDLQNVLDEIGEDITFVMRWYKRLVELGAPLLGIQKTGSDWLELWKNITWSQKESLAGDVRRGIEYIQWALMIKEVVQDHVKHEVLDIDEVSNIGAEDILHYNKPDEMDQKGILLRASRNYLYTNPVTGENHYHNRYKRLNYLANRFGLEYQPKVILFVEGYIEERLLPRIFKWWRGEPGFFGVEIVNLEGVDNLKSTHKDAVQLQELLKDLNRALNVKVVQKANTKALNDLIKKLEKVDIILSNWESFINFNLEKWQAIPFFLADNEGRLQVLLQKSKILKLQDGRYDVPDEWQYLWGVANKNTPLVGDSFELANFTNEEICRAILEVYGKTIEEGAVEDLRISRQALTKIIRSLDEMDSSDKYLKIRIVERLIENLFKEYAETGNQDLFKRPIFKAIDKILRLAALNHAPTSTSGEVRNREAILRQITKKSEI